MISLIRCWSVAHAHACVVLNVMAACASSEEYFPSKIHEGKVLRLVFEAAQSLSPPLSLSPSVWAVSTLMTTRKLRELRSSQHFYSLMYFLSRKEGLRPHQYLLTDDGRAYKLMCEHNGHVLEHIHID